MLLVYYLFVKEKSVICISFEYKDVEIIEFVLTSWVVKTYKLKFTRNTILYTIYFTPKIFFVNKWGGTASSGSQYRSACVEYHDLRNLSQFGIDSITLVEISSMVLFLLIWLSLIGWYYVSNIVLKIKGINYDLYICSVGYLCSVHVHLLKSLDLVARPCSII